MQKEKTNEDTLINKLYTLRAGLSLVSQEKQEVDDIFWRANGQKQYATMIAESDRKKAYDNYITLNKERDRIQNDIRVNANRANQSFFEMKTEKPKIIIFSVFVGILLQLH